MTTVNVLSLFSSGGTTSNLELGQKDSFMWSQSGPFDHSSQLTRSPGDNPLKIKSAGLDFVGTILHEACIVNSWSCATRLGTNIVKRFGEICSQLSTIVEFVHNITLSICLSRTIMVCLASLETMRVPKSSNLHTYVWKRHKTHANLPISHFCWASSKTVSWETDLR